MDYRKKIEQQIALQDYAQAEDLCAKWIESENLKAPRNEKTLKEAFLTMSKVLKLKNLDSTAFDKLADFLT